VRVTLLWENASWSVMRHGGEHENYPSIFLRALVYHAIHYRELSGRSRTMAETRYLVLSDDSKWIVLCGRNGSVILRTTWGQQKGSFACSSTASRTRFGTRLRPSLRLIEAA
jgi:hypothetical protein